MYIAPWSQRSAHALRLFHAATDVLCSPRSNRDVRIFPGAELTAMRLGKYKAFFETAGSGGGGCRYANGTHRWQPATSKRMSHNPPLVFDLDKDPGESTPIKVSDAIYRQLAAAQSAKLYNISNTMRSETNYSEGGTAAWACSNHSSAVCRYYDSPYNP
eukprot:m.256045 g.256045  ORF g.256045 m.256045 type:complete len:159 (+) comp19624_c1_seq1:39-515(+)